MCIFVCISDKSAEFRAKGEELKERKEGLMEARHEARQEAGKLAEAAEEAKQVSYPLTSTVSSLAVLFLNPAMLFFKSSRTNER